MQDSLRLISSLPELRDPVLVVGLAVRQRGGRVAQAALANLAEAWQAKLCAEIAGDEFFNFTVRQPQLRALEERTAIDWPKIQAFVATPAGADHDFLLLHGFEPSFRWPALEALITDYMQSVGVRTLVSLRSFPGEVPHTRPAPVNLTASDIETELQFGIQAESSKYQGPADFAATLSAEAESLGWRTVDLSVILPYYFRPMPTGAASISLIKVLDRAFGTKTLTDKLQIEAAAEARAVDDNLAGNEEAQSMIRELERNYDEGLERTAFLSPGTGTTALPSGAELADDIERFFRENRKPESDLDTK